jgi:altronate hydrolase
MNEDMDINCGVVIDDGMPIDVLGEQIFNRVLEVASGDPTKSEQLGFGDDEFVPWQIGAVM